MGDLKVKITDVNGSSRYVYPRKITARVSDNASTEITLEFDNPDGINAGILKFDDIVEIEDDL